MTAVHTIPLSKGWTLHRVAGETPIELPESIPAEVPGCVHTDLMAAGLIPDPFVDDHERLLAWIGLCDWEYRLSFDVPTTPHAHRALVFDGLDTVASIHLDGVEVATVANMHRTHRLELDDALVPGTHTLSVRFSSPIRYADRMSLELGYRPHVNHHPYNAIRKMAANFGWDWGIDTSTSGIWRPVRLELFDARIASVRPVTELVGDTGRLICHIDVAGRVTGELRVTLGDQVVSQAARVGSQEIVLEVETPRVWCPNGAGSAELYSLRVELLDQGDVVDQVGKRIGFRSVALEFPADKDSDSVGFQFVVNGRATYIRGVNWIPNDAFVHRATGQSLRERLTQARNANINLIRVWGGGIYESDEFYDLCDELGLMVWQDFLFACASYAEEEPMWSEVEAEARDNITRIMSHPSLVLWNGNNENLWGFDEWRWEARLQGKTWGHRYYFELFPQLVASHDPGRAYTPGSPYSPVADARHNDPRYGSVHIWDLWNEKDYPHYRDYHPRFVAEFGWQGPPSWSTLTRSITDDPLTPESPGMLVHQKAMSGNDKLTDGLVAHFDLPNTMDQWHWAMQLNQAHAVATGLAHMRSEFPRNMGSVVWQWNDCWPVTSWAAVDYFGVEKPLAFAIEASYRDVLLVFSPQEGGLDLVVLNNSASDQAGTLSLSLKDFSGEVLAQHTEELSLGRDGASRMTVPPALTQPGRADRSYLVAEWAGEKQYWFFAEFRDLALEPARLSVVVEGEAPQFVTVTAHNLVRDLTLQVDRLDPEARVDSALITLEPGHSHRFAVSGGRLFSEAEFTRPGVLRTANELVRS